MSNVSAADVYLDGMVVFELKPRKVNFEAEIGGTFRSEVAVVLQRYFARRRTLHRGPDGRRKDLSDMRVFPPRETTQIVDILSSSPEESHLQALTAPYVRLSPHTALHSVQKAFSQRQSLSGENGGSSWFPS
jgi:hypothetical protein